MAEVKIMRPGKDGELEVMKRVKVPNYHSQGYRGQVERKKTSYARGVKSRKYK